MRARLLLLALTVLTPLASHALSSDRDQPIEIEADELEIDENRHLSRYQGNVSMRQGSLRIQADSVVLHFDSGNNLQWLDIVGSPAEFEQLDDNQRPVSGSALKMKYYEPRSLIEMHGNARYQTHLDKIESESITINTRTNALQAGQGDGRDRVRMLIKPRSQSVQP